MTKTQQEILRDRRMFSGTEDPYLITPYTDEDFVEIVEEEAPTLYLERKENSEIVFLLTKESRKSKGFIDDNGIRQVAWMIGAVNLKQPINEKLKGLMGMVWFNNWDTRLCECIWKHKNRLEKTKRTGHVYFLLSKRDGLVKIGWATDVDKRLETIQPAYPFTLTLLGSIKAENARQLEQELHHRFAEDRVHGEWFTLSIALKDYISKEISNG